MNTFWNRKQWLWFVALLTIVGVLVWFGPKWYLNLGGIQQKEKTSHILYGEITEIKDGEMAILAVHIVDKDGNNSDFKNKQSVAVTFDVNTGLLKKTWYMPSVDEIRKLEKPVDMATVRRETQSGLLSDLKTGMSITVRTAADTIKSQAVAASEIEYAVFVYAQ